MIQLYQVFTSVQFGIIGIPIIYLLGLRNKPSPSLLPLYKFNKIVPISVKTLCQVQFQLMAGLNFNSIVNLVMILKEARTQRKP